MRKDKDKEKNAPKRVTRRSGTRVGGDPNVLDRDARRSDERTSRNGYEKRYAREERDEDDYRDERDERENRRDRRDRDERDERENRRDRRDRDERDEREDRRDRRDRDERDERENRRDRRDRDERDERENRRNRDERDEREDRRVSEQARSKNGVAHAGTRAPRRGGNPDRTVHQLVPYALFCLSIFAAVSFFLRDIAGLDGETGAFGSFLADFLCGLFGVVAYALPLFMFVLALRWRAFVKKALLLPKILLSTSFLLLLSGIIHVFQESSATRGVVDTAPAVLYGNGVARVGGGFFGGFIGEYLGYIFRLPGTIILAIPLLVIIAIYLIGMTPSGLWERIVCKYRIMQEKRAARRAEMYDGKEAPARKPKKQEPKPSAAEEQKKTQAALAVSEWREPRPLAQSTPTYSFCEEEDEPIFPSRPRGEETPAVGKEQQPAVEPFASDYGEAPVPEQVLQGAMESAPAVEPVPEPTPPPAPQPPVAEPTAQPVEQAPYEGRVYAPFALPVQPFPERPRPAEKPVPPTVAPFADIKEKPTVAPFEDVIPAPAAQNVQGEEELLGMFAPADRPTVTATPIFEEEAPVKEEPVRPLFEAEENVTPVYGAPIAPATERESVVEEELAAPATDSPASKLASPFTAFEPDDLPADSSNSADEAEQEEISDRPAVPLETPRAEQQFVPAFEEDEKEDEPVGEPAPVQAHTERVEPDFAPAAKPVVQPVTPTRPTPVRPTPVPVRVTPVKAVEPEPEPEPVVREYVRPPLHLLNEDKNVRNQDFYEEIEETKDILRQTMASFNIKIQDEINYSHGPSVTRFEMRPVAGTSVRSVTNRTEDIALNLASSVRIEAPIPGKPAIGIEVPNKVRETVYMRTMLESEQFKNSTDPLDVPLGLDVGGEVRMCNLAKMPHLLVAGTTGSGKSVCINSILVSLIYKTSPEDLRLILIDPKQIEFAPYEDVPHLYMPIVTDMQRAAGALACAVQEMERRFSLIRDVGVRNIEAYNEAVKNDPEREHLPYIIIVIDEFADLKMSCNNNDPENFTCRIAQKARAAGIHLIIGTQRPSVDVITGKLKTNIPSRIAFMVKQQVDSRTILDANGAESLTGRGDMLYMPTNSNDKQPVRIQGAFVSDGELERVISFVRRNNDPVRYNKAFMDQIEVEMAKSAKQDRKGDDFDYGDEEEGGEDPKFVEAVELAVQTQKVATSLLQRRLGVGYGRAAKIIDRMEELGLVSAAEGNKPRKLLPAAQGYLEHIGAAESDAAEPDAADDFGDDFA